MTAVSSSEYKASVRAALVSRVASQRRRTRRTVLVATGTGVLLAIGGGAAVASWDVLPGGDAVTVLAPAITASGEGDSTVWIGASPEGATHVDLQFTCLDPGTFVFPDGASVTCGPGDVWSAAGYSMPLDGLGAALTLDATAGARWTVTLRFVSREPTAFETNANGDTYGVERADGSTPTLVAVVATNGQIGYAYAAELSGAQPGSPSEAAEWQREHGDDVVVIPVYLSDGETVIGEFRIGG